ncbi:hypothetical protein HNY73_009124 [Argiope bruennichi]|uniref:Uncharacterized protein n=1 Tax=Argiope bruennichi TaxID=94029 RepID=A0A8T0F9H1_ARGBR|nr:hypothetical protein HNY73_009124 [Argiope bruennichi]
MESIETQTDSELQNAAMEIQAEHKKDDKYRFAYDVVKTVVQWENKITLSDLELPTHSNFHFTDVHSDNVLDFLQQNEKELKKLVSEFTKERQDWNYNDDNYIHCKCKIVEEYKPERYAEKEFVRLCAGIAYVAFGRQSLQQKPNALIATVNELHAWINETLVPGGTLQDSSWA